MFAAAILGSIKRAFKYSDCWDYFMAFSLTNHIYNLNKWERAKMLQDIFLVIRPL